MGVSLLHIYVINKRRGDRMGVSLLHIYVINKGRG